MTVKVDEHRIKVAADQEYNLFLLITSSQLLQDV